MHLSRLWQPRNPGFWLLVVLNGLSAGLGWALRWPDLTPAARWVMAALALGNACLSLWLVWSLVREAPHPPPPPQTHSKP